MMVLEIGLCASNAWGTTLRIVSYNIDCEDRSNVGNTFVGSDHYPIFGDYIVVIPVVAAATCYYADYVPYNYFVF